MNKKVGFIFPGQGAQYPGMGLDFYENFSVAKDIFIKADAILKFPFSKLIFEGSNEELALTKNSQLAIFIVSIAILRVVQEKYSEYQPIICGGLSLGEYTALVAAGKLTFEEALPLVKERAEAMQKACETHPGTMQVVLGLKPRDVEEALTTLTDVWIANLNCPGQVVIAGEKEGMKQAIDCLKEKGATRVIPLNVSGAFHSGLMQPAKKHLASMIQEIPLVDSKIKVVMNVLGSEVRSLEEIRNCMIEQVTSPVYWQRCITAMLQCDIEAFIEIGPGKTLSGMNKRIQVPILTFSVEKIQDLENLGADYATTS